MEKSKLLMERIRDGDDSAFTKLVQPLIDKAYKTAFFIVGSRVDAEDVVQNSLIESYSNIISSDKINNFPAWFHKLVSRRSIDMLRKEKRRNLDIGDNDSFQSNRPNPFEEVIATETNNEVRMAIDSLENADYQRVLVMYYYQELQVSEIAEILDVNVSTVKTHLRRAREVLSRNFILRKGMEACK
ncbi:RNA polymerase sigma factor [Fictibacillus sp. BK138]|uniref:RNA polymerase sigma factor n=1 Tax=Fictibacillus sp. BK138 TaxID=2512121 RepID=UPI00102A4087|nr:RNA polymerase sigma factor [Fictibacillus sp. BK138]RZT15545.1 RNA polymerase sigma-70 factor (ECF subfamily) [Fictibacillus sp. BK138]